MTITLTDLELVELENRFRATARDGGSGDFRLDSPIEIKIGDGRKAAEAIAELLARRAREAARIDARTESLGAHNGSSRRMVGPRWPVHRPRL